MKNIKFMITLLIFSTLLGCATKITADSSVSPDIKLDKDGDVSLLIPKDANKVIANESDKVKYEVKERAILSATLRRGNSTWNFTTTNRAY